MTVSGKHYYAFDAQGSVVALSDESGTETELYTYSPFGEAQQTSSLENPYLFTGRRYDPETGLYYYRARYYDARLGRFLQVDPLGYADSMNLYLYALNNPLNFIDPFGLCAEGGSSFWDGTQLFLDGAGMWPGLGIFPDAANTLISVGRGNWGDAGLNAMAMIPAIGQISTGSKWANRLAKYGDDALQLLPGLKMSGKQFGKKFGKHAADFGLDPSSPSARKWMKEKIESIVGNYDQVKQGAWNPKGGGGSEFLFYRQGNDVVLTKPGGEFVTIMKDGATNEWFKGASQIF